MIKLIVFSTLLSAGELNATIPEEPKIERRRRGKGGKDGRRGGRGLR